MATMLSATSAPDVAAAGPAAAPADRELPRGRTVLIAADTFPPDVNGASYFTSRLAAGLAARGNNVHVVCPSDFGPAATEMRDGVVVHRLRSAPLPTRPRIRAVVPGTAAAALRRIVEQVRPDAVHVQGHFPTSRATMAEARRAGIGVTATNHFMPDNLLHHAPIPKRLRRWVSAIAWRDAARVFAKADHVTTPTPLAAAAFSAGGYEGPIEPVSCGIDLSRFSPRPGLSAHARRGFGLPDRRTVLYVGRLDQEKRIGELVRAIPRLRGAGTDAQLVVAGLGPQAEPLRALAADLGVSPYVRLLGFVPDAELPDLYHAADAFAIAGTAELQSIVTLEAMASALPVVAADAVALPHLVQDGVNGRLFGPGDVEELTAGLHEVLDDPERTARYGEASREAALRHDESRSLERFERIYAEVSTAAGARR